VLRGHQESLGFLKEKDLTERLIAGEQVYAGKLLDVRRDRVRLPDGTEGVREYVRHPGAVMVLPLLADGRVVLERQFRYPHGREFLELPAGKLEPGEEHLATAKRELLEETGYVAAHWTRLGVIHTTVAYSDEAIELFLARGLEKRAAKLDAGEFLEVLAMPLEEAIESVRAGRITDAKTVAALLWIGRWGGQV
jgi:ADP-ribose pyrophosphatase